MSADLPLTTRRLLCVAALWAEQRSQVNSLVGLTLHVHR